MKTTLKKYLSEYSKKRNLDNTIIKWFQKKESLGTEKNKSEWDSLIQEFFGETEKTKKVEEKPKRQYKQNRQEPVEKLED
jgi:hypothetical protein